MRVWTRRSKVGWLRGLFSTTRAAPAPRAACLALLLAMAQQAGASPTRLAILVRSGDESPQCTGTLAAAESPADRGSGNAGQEARQRTDGEGILAWTLDGPTLAQVTIDCPEKNASLSVVVLDDSPGFVVDLERWRSLQVAVRAASGEPAVGATVFSVDERGLEPDAYGRLARPVPVAAGPGTVRIAITDTAERVVALAPRQLPADVLLDDKTSAGPLVVRLQEAEGLVRLAPPDAGRRALLWLSPWGALPFDQEALERRDRPEVAASLVDALLVSNTQRSAFWAFSERAQRTSTWLEPIPLQSRAVHGLLTSTLGVPIEGGSVWDLHTNLVSTASRKDGSFELVAPSPAGGTSHTLLVAARGYLPAIYSSQGAPEGSRLRLTSEARLSGRAVLDNDRPAAGAIVRLEPGGDAPGGAVWTRSDTNGRFSLRVPSPTASVRVVAELGDARAAASVRGASNNVALKLQQPVLVSGRLLDSNDQPLAGTISASQVSSDRIASTGSEPTTGAWSLPLFPGSYNLLAKAARKHATVLQRVEIPAGKPRIDLGVLRLNDGATLSGRVVDEQGLGLAAAQVSVQPLGYQESESTALHRETTTDASGAFAVDELWPEGKFDVAATLEGYAPATLHLVSPSDRLEIVMSRAFTLEGRVRGPDFEPIADAVIRSLLMTRAQPGEASSSQLIATRSHSDGSFRLEGLVEGQWLLGARAEGFANGRVGPLTIEPGSDASGIEMTLEPLRRARGRVVDGSGAGVTGATVVAAPQRQQGAPTTQTDANGGFSISLPSGATDVTFSARGFQPAKKTFPANQKEIEPLVVELRPGARAEGQVVAPDLTPVPGATVYGRGPTGQSLETITDADGRFGALDLEDGSWRFVAQAEGLLSTEPTIAELSAGSPAEVLIRLSQGTRIVGQIENATLDELGTSHVSATAIGSNRVLTGSIQPNGAFVLDGVSPGNWLLTARSEGSGRQAQDVVAIAAGDTEVTASLDFETLTIEGEVTRSGEPLAGALVFASPIDASYGGRAETNYAGAFSISGLAPGHYRVAARYRALTKQLSEPVEAGASVALDLGGVRVTGFVHDARGHGLGGASLVLSAASSTSARGRATANQTQSFPNGSFHFEGVDPGSYSLSAALPGYADANVDVNITGDASTGGIDLTLARTGRTLRVAAAAEPGRQRLGYLQINVSQPGGAPIASGVYSNAYDGALVELPEDASRVVLFVSSPGYPTASRSIDVSGRESVLLTLAAPSTLELDASYVWSGPFRVALVGADGARYTWLTPSGDLADSFSIQSSSSRLTALPPGVWRLSVLGPQPLEQDVALNSGVTTFLQLSPR